MPHILSDYMVFWLSQAVYMIFVAYSIVGHRRVLAEQALGTAIFVERGEPSFRFLAGVFGLGSVLLLQYDTSVIEGMKHPQRFRALVELINVGALFYLCFFNPWSRNRMIDLWNKATKMRD